MKEQKTLNDYLVKNNLTINEFAQITGVSVPHLYRILHNPKYSVNINIVKKIYHGTKKYSGTGLGVWEYLEL